MQLPRGRGRGSGRGSGREATVEASEYWHQFAASALFTGIKATGQTSDTAQQWPLSVPEWDSMISDWRNITRHDEYPHQTIVPCASEKGQGFNSSF